MSQYAPYVPHQRAPWRDNRRLVRVAVALLVAQAATAAISVANLLVLRGRYRDYQRDRDLDRLQRAYTRYSAVSLVPSLVGIAALVLLIVLTYRLAKNHEAIGRPGTRFGPGWAIGGWLIPIASTVIPYLTLVDISKGCDPDEAPFTTTWKTRRAGTELYLWWAVELVRSLTALVFAARLVLGFVRIFRDLGEGDGIATLVDKLVGGAVAGQVVVLTMGAVAQLLGAYAVYRLVQKQESYGHHHQLSTPLHALAPAGWNPDPSGRHQSRYWDGLRWTEHVADDGVGSVDPLG